MLISNASRTKHEQMLRRWIKVEFEAYHANVASTQSSEISEKSHKSKLNQLMNLDNRNMQPQACHNRQVRITHKWVCYPMKGHTIMKINKNRNGKMFFIRLTTLLSIITFITFIIGCNNIDDLVSGLMLLELLLIPIGLVLYYLIRWIYKKLYNIFSKK